MLTKLKLALALSSTLVAGAVGVASANGAFSGDNGPPPQILQKYDANGDGKLDAAERAAMKADWQAKRAERKAKMLAKYDTNRDGKLEPAERAVMRADRTEKQFKKMDTNNDGQISFGEFQAAKAARADHKGGRHRHGMKRGFSGGGWNQRGLAPTNDGPISK